jgi:hypothetical protein
MKIYYLSEVFLPYGVFIRFLCVCFMVYLCVFAHCVFAHCVFDEYLFCFSDVVFSDVVFFEFIFSFLTINNTIFVLMMHINIV